MDKNLLVKDLCNRFLQNKGALEYGHCSITKGLEVFRGNHYYNTFDTIEEAVEAVIVSEKHEPDEY